MSEDSQPGAEARRFTRVEDTLLLSYRISDDVAPSFTETYDVGLGGCAILTNVELDSGQHISIELEIKGDDRGPLRLNAAVRWSRYDRLLDRWRTGIEFIDRDANLDRELARYVETLRRLREMGVL